MTRMILSMIRITQMSMMAMERETTRTRSRCDDPVDDTPNGQNDTEKAARLKTQRMSTVDWHAATRRHETTTRWTAR